MKTMTRRDFLFTTGVAAAAAAMTAAFSPIVSFADDGASSDATLTTVLNAEPAALSGLNATGTEAGLIIMTAVGGTLYRYNGDTREAEPSLASGYEMLDDTHVRFTLRPDACYADGTKVTAADVLYSYRRYAEVGVSNASYFNMDECEAEDDEHVVIAFSSYVPGWLYLVSESSLCVFSEAAVEAIGGLDASDRQVPVSCGKYNFVEWKAGEYILLERNENYWDPDNAGWYKYLKFMFISDAASRALAVQSGDANVAYRIGTTDYIAAQAMPGVDACEIPVDSVYNIVYNCSSEKMSDVKLREAVSYAIDPAAVNALLNMGLGQVCQGLWSPYFPYMHNVYEGGYLPCDQEKAKAALAESAYPDGTTLTLITLATNQNIATIVQENLRQIGITVEISVLEQSVYVQEARAGNYDMQVGSSNVGTVQSNAFNLVDPAKIGKSVQSIRVADEAMTEMVERACSPDEETSKGGFSDIIDYVFENYCLRGLCTTGRYCSVTSGITGITSGDRMGYLDVSGAHM